MVPSSSTPTGTTVMSRSTSGTASRTGATRVAGAGAVASRTGMSGGDGVGAADVGPGGADGTVAAGSGAGCLEVQPTTSVATSAPTRAARTAPAYVRCRRATGQRVVAVARRTTRPAAPMTAMAPSAYGQRAAPGSSAARPS